MSSMMPPLTGAIDNPVVSSTTTSEVREILRQISGQEVWEDRNIWLYFLGQRNDILYTILANYPHKDWRSPNHIRFIDSEFIRLAEIILKDKQELLSGNWLRLRPDLVSWMRTHYWKNNQRSFKYVAGLLAKSRENTDNGKKTDEESSQHVFTSEVTGTELGQDTAAGKKGVGKSWRDVVGLESS